jgi:nicotinate-nucleotide adenylyltransferase
VTVALYGGAFDPPHNGHVALARAALEHFEPERLLVLVVARPGHKAVELGIEERLRLVELAFGSLPRTEVLRDDHERTVETLRAGRWEDPVFLIGGDELEAFPSWVEPDTVLELARLGVASRPGHEGLEHLLAGLARPDRIEFFEIEEVPVSSDEIRDRIRRGEPIDDVVPEAVAREIESAGFYR